MLDQSLPIGQIAATYPSALPVFIKYNINFCCHGDVVLRDACQAAGITAEKLNQEIQTTSSDNNKPLTFDSWAGKSSNDLVDYIEKHYHAGLRVLFPSTIELAIKVSRVHAGNPSLAPDIAPRLQDMWRELTEHMEKEEHVLFPMIRNNMSAHAKTPARVMMMEHESHGRSIMDLKKLIRDYPLPLDACGSWKLLYRSMDQLTIDLMEHIHLENNILFQSLLSHSCCGTCS